MVVILVPLLIWTIAGLIFLWPRGVEGQIDPTIANPPDVTYLTGKVTNVTEISCEGMAGQVTGTTDQICADLAIEMLEGPEQGQTIQAAIPDTIYKTGVSIGERVKMMRIPTESGQPPGYQFSDFDRTIPLAVLALVFAVAVVVVARWRGFASLIGLAFAGFILVKFMFPALVVGTNPVLVGLIGSAAIMFVVLYAAHGFSARTTTALLGTLFGLVLAATIGYIVTRWAHLTGVSSEDDYVLAAAAPNMPLTSVVICGIIIAGLGVLNDVTITQASAVWELADADPDRKRLFSRAMRIGRDHIASTVYTIAFATAGAVLPVLLLIVLYQRPLLEVVQTEMFAGEVIRTLVGSLGLILAVPLTTAIGVAVVRVSDRAGGKPVPATATARAARPSRSAAAQSDTDDTEAGRSTSSGRRMESGRRSESGRRTGQSRAMTDADDDQTRSVTDTDRFRALDADQPPENRDRDITSTLTGLFRRGETNPGRRRRAKPEEEYDDFSDLRDP